MRPHTTKMTVHVCVHACLPDGVRFGPDAGAAQRVGLVVGGLALLLGLQAVLPHGLVHSHVVGQQRVAHVELQPVPNAARVEELSRLRGTRTEKRLNNVRLWASGAVLAQGVSGRCASTLLAKRPDN